MTAKTEKCLPSTVMSKRNRYMVDRSSTVLSVWDGKPSGTGSTVNVMPESQEKEDHHYRSLDIQDI